MATLNELIETLQEMLDDYPELGDQPVNVGYQPGYPLAGTITNVVVIDGEDENDAHADTLGKGESEGAAGVGEPVDERQSVAVALALAGALADAAAGGDGESAARSAGDEVYEPHSVGEPVAERRTRRLRRGRHRDRHDLRSTHRL